ncbi:MAG TPA: ABC transporter permease [Chloroflexota bacterium]|nr:ABC transporter permease [Chloroflexota bacterium]
MNLWIGAVALGLAFAASALGVFLTFRVLAFPDLTVDGSFPLGAAVSAILLTRGYDPWLSLLFAALAGALAGMVTALLNSRLKINGLLAGILVSIALWTVNLRVMQDKANLPLLTVDTILTPVRQYIADPNLRGVFVFGVVTVLLVLLLYWLLHTDIGLALRATGENEKMVRAQGIDADAMRLIGLALANALVAFSGGLVAQYQGFADVGMGLGMIVAGLAAVIIGETLIRPRGVGMTLLAVAAGSVIYRGVIAGALFIGLGPTDMRLVTSLIVIVALAVPRLRALVMPRPLAIQAART